MTGDHSPVATPHEILVDKLCAFSPLALIWVLRNVDLAMLVRTTGWNGAEAARPHAFRDRLVDDIATLTASGEHHGGDRS
jgi:hypothetical protein